MKLKFCKMITAVLLVAFGFALGFFLAPEAAQSESCLKVLSDNAVFLNCAGTYRFMSNPQAGTDITGCKTEPFYDKGNLYHTAIITVVKK